MKKDILIILACLFIGSVIMGCGMSELTRMFLVEDLVLPVFDAATSAAIDTILPGKEGKFKGVKLGMTVAEVKGVIEKSKSLTPVECPLEGIVKATTVMWKSKYWVSFFFHEQRLCQIQFGPEAVSEDLIETEIRKQFANLYYSFYEKFGDPDYSKENFSLKKITVSSFEEASPVLIYAWIKGNVEMRLWLHHETEGNDLEYTNVKYCAIATVSDREVVKKMSEEKIED